MLSTNYLSNVSIVIPVVHSDLGLLKGLTHRASFDSFHQIIVVVSGVDLDREEPPSDYLLTAQRFPNLNFVCVKNLLHPGQARNLGIKSVKTDYVSFLDVRTVPTNEWFNSLSNFVQNHHEGLQPGSVQYIPTSFLSEIFIAATFGFTPLLCLPGSVLSVDTFSTVGSFISARSGEDSE